MGRSMSQGAQLSGTVAAGPSDCPEAGRPLGVYPRRGLVKGVGACQSALQAVKRADAEVQRMPQAGQHRCWIGG